MPAARCHWRELWPASVFCSTAVFKKSTGGSKSPPVALGAGSERELWHSLFPRNGDCGDARRGRQIVENDDASDRKTAVALAAFVGLVATYPAVGIAVAYRSAPYIFPVAALVGGLIGSIGNVTNLLVLIQFPAYGAILAYYATVSFKKFAVTVMLIGNLHLIAFILCAWRR